MRLTGEAQFVSSRTGTKKDGTVWYSLRFRDDIGEAYFNLFTGNQSLFNTVSQFPKNTAVVLTLQIVPGQEYVQLETIEQVSLK